MFYVLMLAGLLVRVLLVPLPGFRADMAYWKGWGLAAADRGILWLVGNTNYNYPPGFAYILWLINKVYALFKNPYNIQEYWLDTNLLYLWLVKSITIASDILVVFFLIKIAQKLRSCLGQVLALFYFLHPVVIFDGSLWGQVDQLGLLLFLVTVYLLLTDRAKLASVVFALSFLIKFQNIIFIPLFYLFVFRRWGFRTLITSLQYSFIASLIVVLPFLVSKQAGPLIRLLTINADWFPLMSLNAFNMWWLVSGLRGMAVSDKNLVLGILSAKQVGFMLFVAAYFFAFVSVFLARQKDLVRVFFVASALAVFGFFHLLTQSHERYAFHLLGILPLIVMLERDHRVRQTFVFTIVFSLFFFLNVYLGMFFNYPDLVIWPFGKATTQAATAVISIVQIIIFLYFLVRFVMPEVLRTWQARRIGGKLYLAFLVVIAVVIMGAHAGYLQKKPVPLVALQPIERKQDYLNPIYNMATVSDVGPHSWQRLSTDYYFYERGIGSHAVSVLVYGLGGRFSRFKTDFGMDTNAGVNAKAIFIIEGDGDELFRSDQRGRFDPPSSVSLDITGVDKLSLRIEPVGSNFGAHADWLNPVLMR